MTTGVGGSGLAFTVSIENFDSRVGGNPIEAAGLSVFPNDLDGFLWGWDRSVARNSPRCGLDETGEFAGIFDGIWFGHDVWERASGCSRAFERPFCGLRIRNSGSMGDLGKNIGF